MQGGGIKWPSLKVRTSYLSKGIAKRLKRQSHEVAEDICNSYIWDKCLIIRTYKGLINDSEKKQTIQ